MKKLGSKGIKVLKTLHLIFAMIWTTGAIAMVLIAFFAEAQSGDELHLKYSILLLIDNWLIITGAMTSLMIGVVYGICTNWGFFKHRWIIVKWIITVVQILFGTFAYHPRLTENLAFISELQEEVVHNVEFIANNRFMEVSGFFQSGLLLFMIVISVFKPWKDKKR